MVRLNVQHKGRDHGDSLLPSHVASLCKGEIYLINRLGNIPLKTVGVNGDSFLPSHVTSLCKGEIY